MTKLGDLAQDKISGFKGIVMARCEWLYGCVRVTLQPQEVHDGKPVDQQTFDEDQVRVLTAGVESSETAPERRGGGREMPPSAPANRR
jgi:hypothetical protein